MDIGAAIAICILIAIGMVIIVYCICGYKCNCKRDDDTIIIIE